MNGGPDPDYQWAVNGIASGTNSPIFTSSILKNGDQVHCTVTSNAPCINYPVANSNIISVAITPSAVPAVTITSTATSTICHGTPVTFNAIPSNGGVNPFYRWKLNGLDVGTNSPMFTSNSLADGDEVSCEMTNAASCNTIKSAISNQIIISVSPE